MKKNKILSLIIISALTLTACSSPKITQTATTMTVELGSKFEINLSDFFATGKPEIFSEFLVDSTAVDMNTAGTYTLAVGYEKERYTISVTVADTIAPEITIKELGTFAENDIVKIEDIATVSDLSDCSVAFLVDNEMVDEITLWGDNPEYTILAEDIHKNQTTENISFIVTVDIFDHISEHCVRKFEYHKDENGKNVATNLSTMSDELKAAILELIPEFSNYPAEYQDKIFKSIAGKSNLSLSVDDIKDSINTAMNEYYKHGYNEQYGEVKGQENSKPENNQGSGNNQGEANNTQGGGNNQAPSAGSNDNGVTPQDPTRVYEDKPEVTITLDDGTQIHYEHTGEYIDGKAVYIDADGNKCHIDVNGGTDLISSNDDWWKNVEHDDNAANFTDHIRE